MKNSFMAHISLAAALTLICGVASASLLGDEVDIDVDIDGMTDVLTFGSVMVTGVEEVTLQPLTVELLFSTDLDADTILIQLDNPLNEVNGGDVDVSSIEVRYTDFDWIPGPGVLTGATVTANLEMVPVMLNFTDDSLTVTFGEFTLEEGGVAAIGIQLDTEHAAPIPEPATMALMGLGLAGLAARRRRHV